MNSTPPTHSRALRLITGWGALLLFVGVASPLGLGIAALAGSLDHTHNMSVQGGGAGLQLVLQHGRKCIVHHHGVVARVLTGFAQPVTATDPDHVIQFSTPEGFSRLAQFTAPAPGTFAHPDLALHETFLPSPRETFLSPVAAHPPPNDAGQLLCLGSTQLLI